VVAAAGADGTSAQRLQDLLRRLERGPAGPHLQIDAICGRGRALRSTLLDLAARLRRVELRVHGYVGDLTARFAAADLALLRASPQALTEAVAAGTPVLAFDWHAHEAANARLLDVLGCGWGSRDPEAVAQALEALVADRRAAGRPDVAPLIGWGFYPIYLGGERPTALDLGRRHWATAERPGGQPPGSARPSLAAHTERAPRLRLRLRLSLTRTRPRLRLAPAPCCAGCHRRLQVRRPTAPRRPAWAQRW
jgi:hypothetical protein